AIHDNADMTMMYTAIPLVEPVASSRPCPMVGANAPPITVPMPYEMETPEKRIFAGKSSVYHAACGPKEKPNPTAKRLRPALTNSGCAVLTKANMGKAKTINQI